MASPPQSPVAKLDARIISNPFTPMRKIFLRRDRSQSLSSSINEGTLGKRSRDEDDSVQQFHHKPTFKTPSLDLRQLSTYSSPCVRQGHRPPVPISVDGRPCLALQNEDTSENAIIITALDRIPFCCHEDLLTMTRSQLVAVAFDLNSKLPALLRIDIGRERSAIAIRQAIEVLVGISSNVPDPPPAPRAIKSRRLNEQPNKGYKVRRYTTAAEVEVEGEESGDDDKHLSTTNAPAWSSSPMAVTTRKRTRVSDFRSFGTPRLARLEEEDEEASASGRALKKRKIIGMLTEEGAEDLIAQTLLETPTRYSSKSRKRSYNASLPQSPATPKILPTRSLSEELPDELTRLNIDFSR